MAAAIFTLLVLGAGGCVSRGPGGITPALSLAPQSGARHQCGPTTLASVLGFHGVPVPEQAISAAIYSPTARGVLLMDLARYAREQGLDAEMRTGSLEDLNRAVAERHPPIVLLDLGIGGMRIPHFTAVTGGTDHGVFLLGAKPGDEFVSLPLFERQWKRAGNQFLVVSPASAPSR